MYYLYTAGVVALHLSYFTSLYFLPRMMELFAENQALHHSLELYFARLGQCTDLHFSAEEQAVWQAFAEAHFNHLLQEEIGEIDVLLIC